MPGRNLTHEFMAFLVVLLLLTPIEHAVRADDWPQWRGPHADGRSDDKKIPLTWSEKENLRWRARLPGRGASSPIVHGDRVYVTCYSGYGQGEAEPDGDPSALKRHLVCVSRRDGRLLWTAEALSEGRVMPYAGFMTKHGYASSTPAADADGVYVFFGTSGAAAYNHDGKRLWKTPLGRGIHDFGSAASVVSHDGLVILNANVEAKAIIALDKKTGAERWRQEADGGSQRTRSTPLLIRVGARHELFFDKREAVAAALDPSSGKLLWESRTNEKYQNPTAVAHDGVIYAIGGARLSSIAIRAGGSGDVSDTHVQWSGRGGSRVSSPIYHDGHVYWVRESEGIATCVNAKTGETVYKERILPKPGDIYASGVLANGRIYLVSRANGTYVFAAQPRYELLARNVIADDTSIFNGSPAISDGCIFLRSDTYLYCFGK